MKLHPIPPSAGHILILLLLVCAVCIAPGMAEESDQPKNETATKGGWSEGHGWYIDPESGILTKLYREFTFCDDSIGGGYRLPDGARIHYAKGYTVVWDKAGKLIANISDENAGPWFSPNPKHESAHKVPLAIEVPSGSYVFHEDIGDTTIARDVDQEKIISKFSSDNVETFPPQAKSDAEHKEPNDHHTWVAWHEIPINQNAPATRIFAKWDVESAPIPHPRSNENQAFHIFPGIDVSERILQPVLSWNWIYEDKTAHRKSNSERNKWSISSHICSKKMDIHSPPKGIGSPKGVIGEIKYINGHWEIKTSWGKDESVLNEVEKTTYPNPPGPNPHVVFTLEKFSFMDYPGECDPQIKKGNKCPEAWEWKNEHWPGEITFSEIKIEPSGSIRHEGARSLSAVYGVPGFKVSSGKTGFFFGSDKVTITTPNLKKEESL